ncbi:hypothetical protein GCM10009623_26530 [Nocardioides aestuarii]|uniref:DUF4272 domain-containing protein n=1 Tax=Nocardioides aestuarii TaxID=252231 RepID=A0ABW4TQ10_9ACTN
MDHLITDADREAFEAEMEAAARGDAAGALAHHLSGLVVERSMHRYRLREIADLGEDAPAWIQSRWCVDQAFRWMLMSEDPRVDDAVRTVLVWAHLDQLERIAGRQPDLMEYGNLVAANDWLVQQMCVYELGGLHDFLDLRAHESFVEKCDHIREWAAAPWGVYRLLSLNDRTVTVRDLVEDRDREVLNVGAFVDQSDTVLGRIVPISVPPFEMFETRPVPVDAVTAREAAAGIRRDPLAVLEAISRGREEQRLEWAFSCHGITMFSNDIVPEPGADREPDGELSGRMRDLVDAGLSTYVANGVVVAEVALIAARVVDDGGAVHIGPHLTAVLTDRAVFEAACVHSVAPEHTASWRRLAAATSAPVSERCLQLAAICERMAA